MKLPKGVRERGHSLIAYVTSPNSKPVRKVIGVKGCVGFKELVRLRAALEKQVRDGLYPEPKPESAQKSPVITCKDLWLAYEKDCETRDVRRIDRAKLAWSHLESAFGSKPAADVRPKDIAEYIESRKASGMAAATCNREISILKASFRHGARLEMVSHVPMFPRKLKEAKPRAGFVKEPQYKTLLSNAREPWLRCFVGIGFTFGLRKGELLALRVRDADLLEGWLTVADSKNGDGRKIKLTNETLTLLTECVRGKQPEDFILTRKDGSRVAQPRKDWYALCVACGFGKKFTEKLADGKTSVRYEGLQMHDLRRSAVRRMIRSGISQTVAMRVSGHKTASVFRRYDITDECDLEQAAKLLEPGRQVSVSEVENRHKTDTVSFAHS